MVVSSGSVVLDPTDGTFDADSGDGKEWRNKGKAGNQSPVRFEVTVKAGTSSGKSFDGKKITFTLSQRSDKASLKIDIHQGDLRIKSAKPLRQPSKGKEILLEEWELDSLEVSSGNAPGSCPLDSTSKIEIQQKSS